jgi:ATP-dependent RNA helicase DDX3X
MGKANRLSALRQLKNARGIDQGDQSGLDTREPAKPLVLILVPTRELATQIFWEARRFSYRTMLRPVCVYGGAPARPQVDDLRGGADILIATPGRLAHFLKDQTLLDLRYLNFTVLDEADELLTEDWEDELNFIFSGPSKFLPLRGRPYLTTSSD